LRSGTGKSHSSNLPTTNLAIETAASFGMALEIALVLFSKPANDLTAGVLGGEAVSERKPQFSKNSFAEAPSAEVPRQPALQELTSC